MRIQARRARRSVGPARPEEQLDREARAIVVDARRRLEELLGKQKHAEWRAALRNERLALRELGQPPKGLKRDPGKDRQAAKRRADALLRKFGVSASKIERIQNDTSAKLRELLVPRGTKAVPGYSMATHAEAFRHLTGLDHVALTDPQIALPPDDPNDPHRWFVYLPPFPNPHTFAYPNNLGGFAIDQQFFSTPAGWIGSEMSLNDSDASDLDVAWGWVKSGFQLPFTPLVAGLVEVAIHVQCLRDLREVSFVDEYGFSWAKAFQSNRLFMYPFGDSETFFDMSYEESDENDTPKNFDKLIPGRHYYAHMISGRTVSRNIPTWVRVGSYNSATALTSDMSVTCRSIIMWHLHSVSIRIAR
jgi:hypothetical protein